MEPTVCYPTGASKLKGAPVPRISGSLLSLAFLGDSRACCLPRVQQRAPATPPATHNSQVRLPGKSRLRWARKPQVRGKRGMKSSSH